MYYSYHNLAKKLIAEGHLIQAQFVDRWNQIAPALVLFFDNHAPMPIREPHFEQYRQLSLEANCVITYQKSDP